MVICHIQIERAIPPRATPAKEVMRATAPVSLIPAAVGVVIVVPIMQYGATISSLLNLGDLAYVSV